MFPEYIHSALYTHLITVRQKKPPKKKNNQIKLGIFLNELLLFSIFTTLFFVTVTYHGFYFWDLCCLLHFYLTKICMHI